jgi:hypothetical protein
MVLAHSPVCVHRGTSATQLGTPRRKPPTRSVERCEPAAHHQLHSTLAEAFLASRMVGASGGRKTQGEAPLVVSL